MGNVTSLLVRGDSGQVVLTMPRSLASALSWEDKDRIEWTISGEGVLLKKIIDEVEDETK